MAWSTAFTLLGAALVVVCVACGPSPAWTEEPATADDVDPSPTPAFEEAVAPPGCRMATGATALQGRAAYWRSVEGMGTVACPPFSGDE